MGVEIAEARSDDKKLIRFNYYLVSHAKELMLIGILLSIFAIKEFFPIIFCDHQMMTLKMMNLVTFMSIMILILLGTGGFLFKRNRNVYLVDFACYKPGSELMCCEEHFMKASIAVGSFSDESLAFQKKILERSGTGQKTYFPESIMKIPPNLCMSEARKEVEAFAFGSIDQVLKKTKISAKDIGILVVNCSLFGPSPSLSAMIVNHYKLRGNIRSYNLGGMGCSAGLISIDLAKNLLQVHPNTYALVVSMEAMSLNWYCGNDKSMLVTNCLFRLGGAAILLSNVKSDRKQSKYQLTHTVRTHNGADDTSYNCVYLQEDKENRVGLSLSKDLMNVAGHVLKTNITSIAPLVLPISEKLRFIITKLVTRKLLNKKIKNYVPDFTLAFDHFCIHAGGRGVLDEMEKNLKLSEWHMEPSRMTLYRFGNTSSSSLWYQLAYCEGKGRIKKGDRVWQIGFGSGFKCNSAVWCALKTVNPVVDQEHNPWMDEIDEFPLEIPRHLVVFKNQP